MRLIVAGNFYGAHKPFLDLFTESIVLPIGGTWEFKKGDVLLLGGGEDISPSLYNQKPSRFCGAGEFLSHRDNWEKTLFNSAVSSNAGIVGICRGAQLICALSGGSLYQHVNNHGNTHAMTTNEGETMMVSSVHHQMMNPTGTNHTLIGWSTYVRSNVHLIEGEKNPKVDVEPEVVFFNDSKALAIQYHPEFMDEDCRAVEFARELVTNLVITKEKSNGTVLA